MPAVLMTSSNVSFLNPISLLVFKSVMTNDRVLDLMAWTSSGIGNISFSLKYLAYLLTLLFSWSVGVFFVFCNCEDQETDVSGGLCAGGIELADENDKSSGFGEGSISLNISVGEFVVCEIGISSSCSRFWKFSRSGINLLVGG